MVDQSSVVNQFYEDSGENMFIPSTLILLSSPLKKLQTCTSALLKAAAKSTQKHIYVSFEPDLVRHTEPVSVTSDFLRWVLSVYDEASIIIPQHDIRVLLHNVSSVVPSKIQTFKPLRLQHEFNTVLTDTHPKYQNDLQNYLSSQYAIKSPLNLVIYASLEKSENSKTQDPRTDTSPNKLFSRSVNVNLSDFICNGHSKTNCEHSQTLDLGENFPFAGKLPLYHGVVLGGTFDRIHNGHKVLLSESCLLARQKLVCGVTTGNMVKYKKLHELIEPLDSRIAGVREFISDIRPDLNQVLEPIPDPFGPSIVVPDLDCIVASDETVKGAEMVNVQRKEKELSQLVIHKINMLADHHRSADEEEKISSSSSRKRLLGTLLREPQVKQLNPKPYVIGLTGGIASGKSSVADRLRKLGASVIDCDRLGHISYQPNEPAYQQLIEAFGGAILAADTKHVDRRQLSAVVFSDSNKLSLLNSIVWPQIALLAQRQLSELAREGADVVVLDAAVLLEAGWDNFTHEVWTCIIPPKEALLRIRQRNPVVSENEAGERITSQLSNEERVLQSNVVLSTLWAPEVTQKQVEKAWCLLHQRRISDTTSKQDKLTSAAHNSCNENE